MDEMAAGSSFQIKKPFDMSKNAVLAALLLIAALISILGYRAWQRGNAEKTTVITASELQERYGMRLYLLGVTAAGGMVDVRLNIVDSEKAGLLLVDETAYPLLVMDSGTVLRAQKDVQPLKSVLKDGSNLFLMFPNAQNVIKPGMPVSIRFGDILVGPIIAR